MRIFISGQWDPQPVSSFELGTYKDPYLASAFFCAGLLLNLELDDPAKNRGSAFLPGGRGLPLSRQVE